MGGDGKGVEIGVKDGRGWVEMGRLWVELGSGRGQGSIEMAEREGRDGKGMGEEGGEGDRWK